MRYVPLIGISVVLLIGIGGRAWLQRRRYGSWGIVLLRSKELGQRLRDASLLLLSLLVVGQSVLFAVSPEMIFGRMLISPRNFSGIILLVGGVVVMTLAQLHLGISWRIGIDEAAKSGLIVHGLYTFCRNPIFLGMFIALAGFTLLIPTLLSVVAFTGTLLAIRQQVFAEEVYLQRTYGDDYLVYASSVGRFLPGIGRLK